MITKGTPDRGEDGGGDGARTLPAEVPLCGTQEGPDPTLVDALGEVGGRDGARTRDPRLAKPMLSQLSYTPVSEISGQRLATRARWSQLGCVPGRRRCPRGSSRSPDPGRWSPKKWWVWVNANPASGRRTPTTSRGPTAPYFT